MQTRTWNQINDALTAEGIRAHNILLILLAMPNDKGERTGATPYTRKQIFDGIVNGYPFSAKLSVRLATRIIARLF